MNMLDVDNVSIAFGGVKALCGAGFSAAPGQIISIIGPNGAGKTTLFNVVSGLYKAMSGTVAICGRDVTGLPAYKLAARGLSRTFQNLQIFERLPVLTNVMIGCHVHEEKSVLADLFGLPSSEQQNTISEAKALAMLERVGLGTDAHRQAGDLPYGALKRLEIARALASDPTILMLDEPAAGCNPREKSELASLIRSIADGGVAVVLVEHDMKLVMKISDHVVVLARGEPLASGTPQEIRANNAVIAAYLGDQDDGGQHAQG